MGEGTARRKARGRGEKEPTSLVTSRDTRIRDFPDGRTRRLGPSLWVWETRSYWCWPRLWWPVRLGSRGRSSPSPKPVEDAQVLVDRLAATPTPPELILVDEWAHDGTFMAGGRPREAGRAYVLESDVEDTCALVDRFYSEMGINLRTMSRSDTEPDEWCGRSIAQAKTSQFGLRPSSHTHWFRTNSRVAPTSSRFDTRFFSRGFAPDLESTHSIVAGVVFELDEAEGFENLG